MFRLMVLTAFLVLCNSERLTSPGFQSFMTEYNRTYKTDEEHNSRYWTFYKNMLQWELMNKMEQGTATYGMNKFADLTVEEFRARYISPVSREDLAKAALLPEAEKLDVSQIPAAVDWRDKNAVTPVKDQKECGSCWAFSTVANIEGRWAIKTGDLISLSEQELVDCDAVDHGCHGGNPWHAYDEVQRLGGLVKEDNYTYQGVRGECKLDKSQAVVQVTGKEHVSKDEEQMAAYVAENGPVVACLNSAAMMSYKGGVSSPWWWSCERDYIDHGVLIVGYGVDKTKNKPYWLIKNSWGADWGEDGYYRLYRGGNTCGIKTYVSSAVV